MAGQYDEQTEDEELGDIQPAEAGGVVPVFHGVGSLADQPREKWARTRNMPKMPAWTRSSQERVTERRRRVVDVFMGGGVNDWSGSMPRIFMQVGCSGSGIAQVAPAGEQVAGSLMGAASAGTFAAHGVSDRLHAGRVGIAADEMRRSAGSRCGSVERMDPCGECLRPALSTMEASR